MVLCLHGQLLQSHTTDKACFEEGSEQSYPIVRHLYARVTSANAGHARIDHLRMLWGGLRLLNIDVTKRLKTDNEWKVQI